MACSTSPTAPETRTRLRNNSRTPLIVYCGLSTGTAMVFLIIRPFSPSACLFRKASSFIKAPSTWELPHIFGNCVIPMAITLQMNEPSGSTGDPSKVAAMICTVPISVRTVFSTGAREPLQPQSHVLGNGRTFNSSAAHIYRARPDGSQLEVVITGGMNNPVGLTFSDTGERFLSGTFFDLSGPGKRDGILHAVYGGMYGRKNDRVLSPHPSSGGLLPILTQMGPAAPSGIVMPKSDALDMRGDLLCSDFNLRRLSRHRLIRSGSTYTAQTSSFLESDQSDFHPTDVIEDADGSLLVADTGSWYKICCPTSKVAKPDVLGAIYRIQKKNAASPEDPRGLELDWSKPQVDWLSDKRPAVIKRSIEALARVSNVDELRATKARIPALWALHRMPGKVARAAVRDFLSDDNVDARVAAIHSAGLWRDSAAVKPLIEILASDDALLRRLAAMALGRIGDRRAVQPLLRGWLGKNGSIFEACRHLRPVRDRK